MKYYFVAGRIYSLSKAELLSLLPNYISDFKVDYIGQKAIVIDTPIDCSESLSSLFSRLGGFVSWGEMVSEEEVFDVNKYEGKKVVFGINLYTEKHDDFGYDEINSLANTIKDVFKENEISSKFLLSKNLILDAFSVARNDLINKGFLLEIFNYNNKRYFGLSKGVQNVSGFSDVEYEKPYTDKRMGVLPSKLARMMVNLTGLKAGQTIWDPFCGSGTILLEAFSQGINVIGSDIDPKACKMSEANIQWLGSKLGDTQTRYKTFRFDVTRPDKHIQSLLRSTQLDGMACEPFMGPPALKQLTEHRAKELLEDVRNLYRSLFNILEFSKLTNFTAVIIIPSYKTHKGWMTLSINEILSKKWEIMNKKWGGDLHWMRSDSIIKRNIFVISKKR